MRIDHGSRWLVLVGLMCVPASARAQIPHGGSLPESTVTSAPSDLHAIPPQYDLSGPRLGATFGPDGSARSQFGWHFEHQTEASSRGPWLVVETVLLVGGVEQRLFIPSGTLVFGVRLPDGYEVGLGPNLTISSPEGFHTSVVAAVGKTFRIDGIQIPLNVAYAFDKDGARVSVVTGWAVRRPPDDWRY